MAITRNFVFGETFYNVLANLLYININLFNRATNGAIRLAPQQIRGFVEQQIGLGLLPNDLITSADPINNSTVPDVTFSQQLDNIVKLFYTTKRITWTKREFNLVKANEEEAIGNIARQISQLMMSELVSTALTSVTTCIGMNNALITDDSTNKISHKALIKAGAPMGDNLNAIKVWLMHSQQYYDLIQAGLDNTTRLFEFGTVNVFRDAIGRHFVISDVAELKAANNKFNVLGLTSDAVTVGNNDDFVDSSDEDNTKANIMISYKAEWSNTLKVKNRRYKGAETALVTKATVAQALNWEIVKPNEPKIEPGVLLKVA